MVALKPFRKKSGGREIDGKQERRGGIETVQHVTGLIEGILEAGTPWWH